jgi:hypothetical protein
MGTVHRALLKPALIITAAIAMVSIYTLISSIPHPNSGTGKKSIFTSWLSDNLAIEGSQLSSFGKLQNDPVTRSLQTANITHENRRGQDGPYRLESPGKDPSNGEGAALLKYFNKTVQL